MTFDDLQQQWQGSNESSTQQSVDVDSLIRTCRRVEKYKSGIFRRDMIESLAGILAIIVFGKKIFTLESWIARFGAFTCVCGAVLILYKLHRARRVKGSARLDLSLREYLQIEIQRAKKQIHLLRTITSYEQLLRGISLLAWG